MARDPEPDSRIEARVEWLQALERRGIAALLLDSQARLLHANLRAEASLHAGCGLSLRGGRVLTEDPLLALRWPHLVQRGGWLPGTGGLPVTAFVAPLDGFRRVARTVLVLIRDPQAPAAPRSASCSTRRAPKL